LYNLRIVKHSFKSILKLSDEYSHMETQTLGFKASSLLRSRVRVAAQERGITATEFMRQAIENELVKGHQIDQDSPELTGIKELADICRATLLTTVSLGLNSNATKEEILSKAKNTVLYGSPRLKARLKGEDD
jgi:hypothetical protein